MSLNGLCGIAFLVWLIIGFRGEQARRINRERFPFLFLSLWVTLWLLVMITWRSENLAVQWICVETSTLAGSLLIAANRLKKSVETAWKFLLINSFGLAVGFLGLILVAYGYGNPAGLDAPALANSPGRESLVSEMGVWLMIFGYTTKLGLFPNHFWVKDTYSESPPHVAAILAALLPTIAAFPLYTLLEVANVSLPRGIGARDGLMILGSLTVIYALLAVYQTRDLRKLAAYTAMFHNGAVGLFLWLEPSRELFLFLMATIIVVKGALFLAVKPLRGPDQSTSLETLSSGASLSRFGVGAFLIALFVAFVFPLSPVFVSDLLFLQAGLYRGHGLVPALLIASSIFFAVAASKVIPLVGVPDDGRREPESYWASVLIAGAISLGVYGFWAWPVGGFLHVP